jgi:hypothetical protein
MRRVKFITTESNGIDLILSFALSCGRGWDVDSLTLLRTPKYEAHLPEEEGGVSVSLNQESGHARLLEFSYSESEKVVRLKSDARRYELDVSKVSEDDLERMADVIARMNFDGDFVLSGIEPAEPAPEAGLETTMRSALRAAERGRAQDQGQPPDEAQIRGDGCRHSGRESAAAPWGTKERSGKCRGIARVLEPSGSDSGTADP